MYTTINGIKYYFKDEGTGPVMILLHGLGENADSWRFQTEYFKNNFRVIVPDLRGHHRTEDGNISEISIDQFSEDIISLLNFLKVEKAHFIGFSMGGIILMKLTEKYQKRMISLSICNSASYVPPNIFTSLTDSIAMTNCMTMDSIAHFVVTTCLPEKYDQKVYNEAFETFRKNRKDPYIAARTATFSIDYRDILKKITTPTFILCGSEDAATPVYSGEYMHDNIKNSKMQIIPGVGHLSKLEAPDLFNKAIADFLYSFEQKAIKALFK